MTLLLSPFAPHITEELWSQREHKGSIHQASWPTWDDAVAKEDVMVVPIQINGKVRDRLEVAAGTASEELERLALASERVQLYLEGKPPRKVIVVGNGRLINIVK